MNQNITDATAEIRRDLTNAAIPIAEPEQDTCAERLATLTSLILVQVTAIETENA